MNISLDFIEWNSIKADAVIIYTFEDKDTEEFKKVKELYKQQVDDLYKSKEFRGKTKTLALIRAPESSYKRIALGGLGKEKEFDFTMFMSLNSTLVATLQDKGLKNIAIVIPRLPKKEEEECIELATISSMSGAYRFTKYKTVEKEDINYLENIVLLYSGKNKDKVQKKFRKAMILADSIRFLKDLQNTPPNELTPKIMAEEAGKVAKEKGLRFTAWNMSELKKRGFNAIVSVGKGSVNEPYLITLEYRKKGAKKTICLVGKGLTFDSGGINIKPWERMDEMKSDMSGAGVVLGVMKTVAELKPNLNVIGILGCAENMPSGSAYKPGDIIKTKSGKTIEVLHTDAEGRVVLADALYHATTFKPDYIVDVATLTGACVVCLGTVGAALISNDDKLAETIIKSSEKTGEKVWRLPMWPEFAEDVKSKIADVKNVGFMGEGGTITAAFFLYNFVEKYKWAHLDIAGTAYASLRERYMTALGGTGYGIRLLTEFLENI